MTRDEKIERLKAFRDYLTAGNPIWDMEMVKETFDSAIEALERQHGEWLEREVIQDRKDAKISEWQSAKCSVCGKYHTTPYMYYFTNYKYCPNCGERMKEGATIRNLKLD